MRTLKEYREAVREIAEEAIKATEAGENSMGDYVTETVDGSDWIIYTAHNLAVMAYTDHDDAVFDDLGADALQGLDSTGQVYQRIAYFAMVADVLDEIDRV